MIWLAPQNTDHTGTQRPLVPAASQATIMSGSPRVVVFSVPAKKHHDSSGSPDSGDSGSSVSNTVNGADVGGAITYNNHTSTPGSSRGASWPPAAGSSSTSPRQLEDNTGAGVGAVDPQITPGSAPGLSAGSGIDSSVAPRGAAPTMLMWVGCPTSIPTGTICFQITSDAGQAANLPTLGGPASTPALRGVPPVALAAPSVPGQTVTGATNDLGALVAKMGQHIELTGYSFQDNQGGNNSKISCPQIHQQAGGTGTYEDPITVASGGKDGSASADGIKCGDRFYLPSVQRYVIVEDTGNTPNKSMPHLDMYVADDPNKSCMNKISGTVTALPHPPPGLPVLAGPIGEHGSCRLPSTGVNGGPS